ncbi:MAG TPA: CotH kinase family protein [Bacteroidales bacterium]|nr:CotH kinase family protein [Bacteroidales bacterium]
MPLQMSRIYSFTLLFLILNTCIHAGLPGQIVINEFQASNSGSIQDPLFNDYSDWIELYNGNSSPADVSGYFLTDDLHHPSNWQIPSGTVIPADDYLVIWADGRNQALHTNFKISGGGEELGLFDKQATLIDSVTFGIQYSDVSCGRTSSGTGWAFFTVPTPGEPNSGANFSDVSGEPQFSIPGGFYDTPVSIDISAFNDGAFVRYTTDGSPPDTTSQQITGSLNLAATTIVRARIYEDGRLPGKVVSHTYFVDETAHDIPVISIFTKSDNLWDPETGIYVNYENDLEVSCGLEYFTSAGEPAFSQNAGLSIFGGTSRQKPQKSFAIHIRDKYGDGPIQYHLLPGRETTVYKSFILRNSANDWSGDFRGTMFRDALVHSIVENQGDLDYQAYQPVAVYLNGEYWGILNLRDKHNEDYCEVHYGTNRDSVDIIKNNEVVAGNDILYNDMMTFLSNHDLSLDENYEIAASMIDIDEFINYMITEIYSCNIDWPANNYRLWRPETENGKWRWMLFDTDFGFNGFPWALPSTNMFDKAMDPDIDDYVRKGLKAPWATMVFIKLTQNETFRNKFISMFISRVNTTYKPSRVIHIIDSLAANLETEMPRHIALWSDDGGIVSMPEWRENIQGMKDFANQRPAWALQHLRETFGLQPDDLVNVEIYSEEGGRIILDGIPLNRQDFTTEYYTGLPLSLEAESAAGYRFVEWVITDLSGENAEPVKESNSSVELAVNGPIQITAHISEDVDVPGLRINEVMAGNTNSIVDEWGDHDDWIELFNPGSDTVDLGGLFMSDSPDNPLKWQIPSTQPGQTTVEPAGFVLLWADNEPGEGNLHLGFKLNKSGEHVGIYKQLKDEVAMIDSLSFSAIPEDFSFGRYPDGSGPWTEFSSPTPGYENSPADIQPAYPGLENPVIYPNPTSGIIKIRCDYSRNHGAVPETMVSIIDYSGHVVRKLNFSAAEALEADLSDLPDGLYLVRVSTGGHSITRRVILLK